MKRDLSLIRLMLLRIEGLSGPQRVLRVADFADLCSSREKIIFHIKLLLDAAMICGRSDSVSECSTGVCVDVWVKRLTFSGCEYLDAVRDDSLWRQICKHLDRVSSNGATIEVIKALAENLILNPQC